MINCQLFCRRIISRAAVEFITVRMATNKRKLFCLNAEQKREICVYFSNNQSKTHKDIADVFSVKFNHPVSRRTVGDIIAAKEKWMDVTCNEAKKQRLGKHHDLEAALQVWFASTRSQNVVITDAVLREKAKQFGGDLGITDFHYSNGWLQRFKGRCGIASQTICGESAGVDPNVISRGRLQAAQWIKDYALCDVYNLDETGLFYRMPPDRSLTTADKTKGVKKPKDRISVMLCANADGSDKLRPLIIGKTQKPRCFKQFNPSLYCDYYANKKAWMVNGILREFLVSFNRRMAREKRKVLLLMDNAPSHLIPENLRNVRCEFLPPTTTSHLQPMDAGIINAYKAHYRGHLVRFIVDAIDGGRPTRVEISDAIRWTKLSWDAVTADTIINCWHHTGILPPAEPSQAGGERGESDASPSTATGTTTPVTPRSLQRDFGNLFERLSQSLNIPAELLMTADEYVGVDSQLETSESMADSDILAMVTSQASQESDGEEGEEGDGEDDDDAEPESDGRVAPTAAGSAIDTLMRYFEQNPLSTADDIYHLSVIKRRIDFMRVSSQKQSSICDFFKSK